jgi:hypothetical protein
VVLGALIGKVKSPCATPAQPWLPARRLFATLPAAARPVVDRAGLGYGRLTDLNRRPSRGDGAWTMGDSTPTKMQFDLLAERQDVPHRKEGRA